MVDHEHPPREEPRLTYRELCEGALTQIFPSCTEWDLLEVWSTIDPANHGTVTLFDVVANLGGARPASPQPGPARYAPENADNITRANKHHLPSMESVPLPYSAYSSSASLLKASSPRAASSTHLNS